jgi:hypothetical protein
LDEDDRRIGPFGIDRGRFLDDPLGLGLRRRPQPPQSGSGARRPGRRDVVVRAAGGR